MGLASNNPYAIIGSMRELILMLSYEMVLTVALITIFVFNNILSVAQFDSFLLFWKLPIAAICFFSVACLELRITPYDTIEASTEILESVKSEYSGRGLAFIELGKALKFTFFAILTVFLFIGNFNLLLFFVLSVLMVIIFSFTQASTCRYRLDQTSKIFIFILILALVEFIRIKYIIW
jgi:NADH-quinone oxidoreductase subunit H